jgi:hypothetical protein
MLYAADFGVVVLPPSDFVIDTISSIVEYVVDDLVDIEGNPKEGRLLFESSDVAFGYIAGLRWDIPPALLSTPLSLGVTWQVVPDLMLDGTARIAYGTAEPFTLSARLPFPLADTLRAGAALGLSQRVTLRPSFEWARWSVLGRQVAVANADDTPLLEIERDFSDAFGARLRGEVRVTESLTLLGGGGWDFGPTPSRTHEPGLAEGDAWEAAAGAREGAADGPGALPLRPLSEHGSCPPRVYIHVPTILTEKGLCVTHCLCENKLHSESTPGPALAAGYFLSAMLALPSADSEYAGCDKPPSNATRGKRRREAPPFPPSCMSTMPVTESLPPTPPSYLNVWSEELCPNPNFALFA